MLSLSTYIAINGRLFFFFFLLFFTLNTNAQVADNITNNILVVKDVLIFGNKKTKNSIILREIVIKSGDTLYRESLDSLLLIERNKVFNLGIFVSAEVKAVATGINTVDILISVQEQWYLFPIPILDIADRNFNEWINQRGADPRRLEYGIRVNWRNFRGRRENVKTTFQFGFTKLLGLKYTIPYINKKQTIGLGFATSYAVNKEIPYATISNKLAFLRTDENIRERFYMGAALSYRKNYYQFHSLEYTFNQNSIADTVAKLNPAYFLEGKTSQTYSTLSYNYTYDFRDYQVYPTKGYIFNTSATVFGIFPHDDLRNLQATLSYGTYYTLAARFFYDNLTKIKVATKGLLAYPNYRGFGFTGNMLRGYDLYVIDAQNTFMNQSTLRYKLFDRVLNINSVIKMEEFNKIPLQIYLKTFFDVGYAYNPFTIKTNERLTNTALWTTGVGFDFVSYYNSTFRIEYALNSILETGIFFYWNAEL